MKKTLSILAAICIILSSSIIAFAQEKTITDKVMEQMEGAVAYLTDGAKGYGVDQAVDYYTLVASGVDLSKFNDGFLNDVKKNLELNDGKIISSYGESLATYGAVILALDELGEDPYDFYGYDIVKAFSAMDPTEPQANAYYYRVIIPATIYCYDDEDFAKSVCDTFVDNNYVMGKGMPLYGYYSADNTAYFITSLAMYAEEYPEIMADAFAVLEGYCKENGYFSDPVYSPEANTDSTALALMAYSSVLFSVEDDELEAYFAKVNDIYNDLCTFEGSKTGVFISSYSGEDDVYATKDALMGLEEYYYVAMIEEWLNEDESNNPSNDDPTETTKPTTVKPVDTTDKTTAPNKTNTSKKSPSTGADTCIIAFSAAILGVGIVSILKKQNNAE